MTTLKVRRCLNKYVYKMSKYVYELSQDTHLRLQPQHFFFNFWLSLQSCKMYMEHIGYVLCFSLKRFAVKTVKYNIWDWTPYERRVLGDFDVCHFNYHEHSSNVNHEHTQS